MPRRIRSRPLPAWRDPETVFLALAGDGDHAVWLDGGRDARTGRSVVAVPDPGAVVRADVAPGPGEPRQALDGLAAALAPRAVDGRDEIAGGSPLGWIGWFGYEFGAELLGLPAAPATTPDAAFAFVDRAVVFDHASGRMHLEWLEDDGGAGGDRVDGVDGGDRVGAVRDVASDGARWADATAARIAALPAGAPSATPRGEQPASSTGAAADDPRVRWRHDPDAYRELILACQAAIVRGDAYQLCLTNRIDVDVRPDPVATYLRLRRSSPSHHGGLLRFGDVALLSASPEQFLLVDGDGLVMTKPMKGTRPRAADPSADAALRAELEASDKERAENLMIVDLMRNDLGRIAELGTVAVPSLLQVEEYPHVHQLVSTVTARLRHPLTALDAVASAFPAGSMTGAPKESAMRILHDLERGPRGVYSGAFGCLSVDGGADLAMVIRAIVLTPDGAAIGTGGGITALSVPDEEIEETRVKARALLDVLVGGGAPPDATAGARAASGPGAGRIA